MKSFDDLLLQMKLLFDETHRRIDAALSSKMEFVEAPRNQLTGEDVDDDDISTDAVSTVKHTQGCSDLETDVPDNALHLDQRPSTSLIRMVRFDFIATATFTSDKLEEPFLLQLSGEGLYSTTTSFFALKISKGYRYQNWNLPKIALSRTIYGLCADPKKVRRLRTRLFVM